MTAKSHFDTKFSVQYNYVAFLHNNESKYFAGTYAGVNILQKASTSVADFGRVSAKENACACLENKFGRDSHN